MRSVQPEEQAAGLRGARVAYLRMREVDRAVTAGQAEGFIRLIAGPAGSPRLPPRT